VELSVIFEAVGIGRFRSSKQWNMECPGIGRAGPVVLDKDFTDSCAFVDNPVWAYYPTSSRFTFGGLCYRNNRLIGS
jgi:hypothetical protein